jgi:hypothetical protein
VQAIRSDVYQVISFAVGFGVKTCALFSFSQDATVSKETIVVGGISVTHFRWPTNTPPGDAERQLIAKVRAWLGDTLSTEIPTRSD